LVLADASGRLDSVELRHLEVDEHDVWPMLSGGADGGVSVAGLGHDFESVVVLEDGPEAGPDGRVIVDEDDAER
jgi:hypothetical protein